MHRRLTLAFCITVSLVALSGQARAQWGYGFYPYGYGGFGWGGWGGTAQGSIARGLGYFNMGAGIYNRETAVARSINTDTMIRWNQYVYNSQLEATRHYFARRDAHLAQDRDAYNALLKRLQETPNAHDVQNGDALNAALDQLSDPRIGISALRTADTTLSARSIREIPFRNASEAVTFSLAQLKKSSEWPAVLLETRFATERKEFEDTVDQINKENNESEQISPRTITRLRNVAGQLKNKLAIMPLDDSAENQEALKFVKTVTALARLLEKPEIDEVLNELKKIDKTTVGNLLAFMQTFNLRFAPASTARQRAAYNELYPVLAQTRDRILGEAKLDNPSDKANKAKVHDFFSAMDLDQIEGKKKQAPAPPEPRQP